jgi:hypothetical protein
MRRKAQARWTSDDTFHVETELGIVNIHLGLHNLEGQRVENIEVLANADRYAGEKPAFVEGDRKRSAAYVRIIELEK